MKSLELLKEPAYELLLVASRTINVLDIEVSLLVAIESNIIHTAFVQEATTDVHHATCLMVVHVDRRGLRGVVLDCNGPSSVKLVAILCRF